MAKTRFVVMFTPAAKVIAAARKNGWKPDSDESLLDACGDHFSFEEDDSHHATLDAAVGRGKAIINEGLDLFGQVSVHEEEYRLIVPADGYCDWETVTRHLVDETGLVESVSEDCGA